MASIAPALRYSPRMRAARLSVRPEDASARRSARRVPDVGTLIASAGTLSAAREHRISPAALATAAAAMALGAWPEARESAIAPWRFRNCQLFQGAEVGPLRVTHCEAIWDMSCRGRT